MGRLVVRADLEECLLGAEGHSVYVGIIRSIVDQVKTAAVAHVNHQLVLTNRQAS